MATTVRVPNSALRRLATAGFNLGTDDMRVLLTNSAFVFNADTQEFRSNVEANEVTGTGYTAGGIVLAGESLTQDNTNNRAIFDYTNPIFSNVTISPAGAWIYKFTGGGSATDPLLYFLDFGGTQSIVAADFEINLDAVGALIFRKEPVET